MPERHIVHPRRLAVAGVALAAAVAFAGFGLEAWRLGPNDAAAARKIEARVRTQFAEMTTSLQRVAHAVASSDVVRGRMRATADDEAARILFNEAERALQTGPSGPPPYAITIYTQGGAARAWAGRPSDIPLERLDRVADGRLSDVQLARGLRKAACARQHTERANLPTIERCFHV